ncbi:DNA alkylation repair protein [Gilliamella apicola]|uniref:DNA alkylation repair protein n=1 Tax=Gilliamella apicola TaxID=1196095 RepID=A0A242NDE0_9GAMM|nr:DNA alkylation repair protein [Gilliamella apicola]OTP81330.1 DNA alkylation repair protein [Gilliamella apicola]OTP82876.1 DNA alkylation repair protein [Gilliamella apicola]OTP97737.1 DNA alkylation repair protein [Gilliamella apicola]OTQ08002.1 DNA alkylation repair protein [Gilliamella apicola]OTQ10227.1 DNA alkylation repair protein [Gilliamella apicola]
MREKIRKELEIIAEENYRIFAAKLIPNIDNLLGVRLPKLRKIAKKIVQLDYEYYLAMDNHLYFEEVMLQGMIIGEIKLPWTERSRYVKQFISKIDNWSVCDSFCCGLKFEVSEKELVWQFLQPYFASDKPYDIRFAVVMLLFYFVDDEYAQKAFTLFDQIKNEDYYVKMAVAWAISIYFRELPTLTMLYLQKNQLDDWIYNKALQKITESLKVDSSTKIIIRSMKRKINKL